MDIFKHHGVFRGAATVPLATFFVKDDAEDYASRQSGVTIKDCYIHCGYLCPGCGSLVADGEEELSDE